MPYVYGDIFLAVNLLADGAILYAAGRLAGVRAQAWRLFLGALAGAVYAFGYLFPELSPFYAPAAKLTMSLVILAIAYAPQPPRAMLRLAAWLYACSALAAGAALGLASLGADTLLAPGAGGAGSIPWWALAVLFLAFGLAVWQAAERVRGWLPSQPWYVPVEVVMDRKRLRCVGLVDTGHHLHDPLSGRPVLVVEFDAVAPLLPPELRGLFAGGDPERAAALLSACGAGWTRRIRVLPFATLGGKSGLLFGFRPDLVAVGGEGERQVTAGVTVAVVVERLAEGGEYQALVPPALWQRRERVRVQAEVV